MIGESIVSVLFLVLLVLLLNPFHFWMPTEAHMMILVIFIVLFAVFAAFVFKEHARDEREVLHRYIANRFAYLFGVGVLVVGIVVQSLSHALDGWLLLSLSVMIVAKLLGLIYSRLKH